MALPPWRCWSFCWKCYFHHTQVSVVGCHAQLVWGNDKAHKWGRIHWEIGLVSLPVSLLWKLQLWTYWTFLVKIKKGKGGGGDLFSLNNGYNSVIVLSKSMCTSLWQWIYIWKTNNQMQVLSPQTKSILLEQWLKIPRDLSSRCTPLTVNLYPPFPLTKKKKKRKTHTHTQKVNSGKT